jgi:hypothetical protein
MKRTKSIAEGIRNQNLFLFKNSFSEQDEKIMGMLGTLVVGNAWELSANTGIFITSCRRSITNLKQSGQIKECGSKIGIAGAKNTLYALWNTKQSDIDDAKKQKVLEEKELEMLREKAQMQIAKM